MNERTQWGFIALALGMVAWGLLREGDGPTTRGGVPVYDPAGPHKTRPITDASPASTPLGRSAATPASAAPATPVSTAPSTPIARQDVAVGSLPSRGGGPHAPVLLVEFSDFQCAYCKKLTPTLDRVVENYGERVAVYFRDYPLTGLHPKSKNLHAAARCAAQQDRFWPMHHAIFEDDQGMLDHPEDVMHRLGLDASRMRACLADPATAQAVLDDAAAAKALGIRGTPTMFINGRKVPGAQPYEKLSAILDEELARAR